ncbi:U3 snoRNP protein, partial [Clydaea vesicula]
MLARDLQDQFYPHFVLIFENVLLILNDADPTRLELIYNTIAHLFKFLSNHLTNDILVIFNMLIPSLKDNKSHIRLFSSQVLGFLMRKIKITSYDVVFQNIIISLNENSSEAYSDGIAGLFFEMVKQVNNTIHSKAKAVASTLFDIFFHNDKITGNDVAFLMLLKFCTLVGHHTSKENFSEIWELIKEKKAVTLVAETDVDSFLRIGKYFAVLYIFVTIDGGRKIVDRKILFQLIQHSIEFLLKLKKFEKFENSIKYSLQQMVKLTSSVFETSTLETALVYGKQTLDLIFNSKENVCIFAFCETIRLRKWIHFPKLITPRILSYLQTNFESDPVRSIVFLSNVFGLEFATMMDSVPKHMKSSDNQLNLNVTRAEDQQKIPLSELLISKYLKVLDWQNEASVVFEESSSIIPVVYSVLNSLNFLFVDFDNFFNILKENFISMVTSIEFLIQQKKDLENLKKAKILMILSANMLNTLVSKCLRLNKCLKLLELFDVIAKKYVKCNLGDGSSLKAIFEYLEALKSVRSVSKKIDLCFSVEQLTIMLPLLEDYVGSTNHLARLNALKIINCFDQSPLLNSATPCLLIQHCIDIEATPDELQSLREKTMHLRKLESLQCAKTCPSQYAYVAIKYCLALLSLNFMPFVEEVIQAIKKICDSDIKRFWEVYKLVIIKVKGSDSFNNLNDNVIWIPNFNKIADDQEIEDIVHTDTKRNNKKITFKNKQNKKFKSSNIDTADVAVHVLGIRFEKAYNISRNFMEVMFMDFQKACFKSIQEINIANYYLVLIKAIGNIPHIIDQRSAFLVPMFLELFDSKIKNGDFFLEDYTEEVISDGKQPKNNVNLVPDLRKQILEFLSMFSKVKHPQKLFKSSSLKNIILSLLSNGDSPIQEKAFDCILAYKNSSILSYTEFFKGLIDDERFRDSLSGFSLENFGAHIKDENRSEFIQVLARILYGKLINRKGRGSNKSGLKARRGAIFSFYSAFECNDHLELVNLMIQPFQKILQNDVEMKVEFSLNSLHKESLPSPKVQIGFLTVLEDFLKQFKTKAEPFLPKVLSVLINLLAISDSLLRKENVEDDEDVMEEDALEDNIEVHSIDILALKQFKNIRSLVIRRLKQIYEMDLSFNFQPYLASIFSSYIDARIAKFSTENTQAPSALMELIYTWANNRKYVLYLHHNKKLLPQVLNLLSAKKVQDSVVSKVLSIIEAIILVDAEVNGEENSMNDIEFTVSILDTLLVPEIDCLLLNLKVLLMNNSSNNEKKILSKLNYVNSISNRVLAILAKLSKFLKNSTHIKNLIEMMLPFLKKQTNQVPEKAKVEILTVLNVYLTTLDSHQRSNEEDFQKYFVVSSELFSALETREARNSVVSVFKTLSSIDASLKVVYVHVENLNAFSIKRLDEKDFDKRFSALKAISNSSNTLSPYQWLPILHNLLFHIQDVEEYSIRTACLNGILNLVEKAFADSTTENFKEVAAEHSFMNLVFNTILPYVKRGLRIKNEVVRQEFLQILCALVSSFPKHGQLVDMVVLLSNGNEEANFFKNIHHLQIHRRIKALRQLAEHSENGNLSIKNINTIFIPLVSHFIFETDRVEGHQLVNETIHALSSCAGVLSWSQYYAIIRQYFFVLKKKPDLEQIAIRVIVSILEKFHFDVSLPDSILASTATTVAVIEKKMDLDNHEEHLQVEEEIPMDLDDGKDVQEEDLNLKNYNLNSKIHSILCEKIIPDLHKLLAKKEDENLVVRVPVAIAITNLLKQLPSDTLQLLLPKLIFTLCNILKSRQQSARDTTREIVVKVALILGMSYIPFIIKELFNVLTKGYQLHVLGYTIHSLLVGIAPTIIGSSPELDSSSELLVKIFVADIFGEIGDEKEADELRGKMREIKKTKSYDSFELLSKMISMSTVTSLLLPLKEIMLETNNMKITRKVDEVLKRISQGLSSNSSVVVKDLMVFVHDLITENLSLAKVNDGSKVEKTNLEKNYEIKLKRPDVMEPLKYFQGNAFRFIEFGFTLLLSALRRELVDVRNDEHLAMLDPLIMVLGKALYSKHASVIVLVLKILAIIVKCPLPSLDDALKVIVKKVLSIVGNSVNSGSEVVQNCFKLLTIIIRERKNTDIKESHLIIILELLKPDLEEAERQSVTFSLIRAIISRKYVVNVVYDLMNDVAKVMVTSQSAQIRELCRYTYFQFLLDYPQGKQRFQTQWNHIIKNLQYAFESGRESVMELLHLILNKFPDTIIFEYSEVLFVSLVVNLVNDDSSKCRQMTGILLKKLFQRNGLDRSEKLLELADKWFEKVDQPELLRSAAQVYGLAVEALGVKIKKWLPSLLNNLSNNLKLTITEMEEKVQHEEDKVDLDEGEVNFDFWECGYYANLSIGKIIQEFKSAELDNIEQITQQLVRLILHQHQWLRISSSKTIGLIFSFIDPTNFTYIGKNKKFEMLEAEGCLYEIGLKTSLQLQGKLVGTELATQIVKNLFFLGKCMYFNKTCDKMQPNSGLVEEAKEENNTTNDTTKESTTLLHLIKKLCYFARTAKTTKETTILRSNIFKLFAAYISFIPTISIQFYITPIFSTLYRASVENLAKGPEA